VECQRAVAQIPLGNSLSRLDSIETEAEKGFRWNPMRCPSPSARPPQPDCSCNSPDSVEDKYKQRRERAEVKAHIALVRFEGEDHEKLHKRRA